MNAEAADIFDVTPAYRPVFEALGLTARTVFTDPRVVAWRSVTERQNCTLDVELAGGGARRLHVKRYFPHRGSVTPAEEESRAIRLLESAAIPTPALVAWGRLGDGRSFIVTEDLAGYRAADKLIADGLEFERLLAPTADLAAKLHRAGLHHRDLYLCHFFVRPSDLDLRLIDPGRVRQLPKLFTQRRWVVKDLAQFWYSTTSLEVTDAQRAAWLARYAGQEGVRSPCRLQRSVERKSAAIARHDAKLRAAQPKRNISIPGA